MHMCLFFGLTTYHSFSNEHIQIFHTVCVYSAQLKVAVVRRGGGTGFCRIFATRKRKALKCPPVFMMIQVEISIMHEHAKIGH